MPAQNETTPPRQDSVTPPPKSPTRHESPRRAALAAAESIADFYPPARSLRAKNASPQGVHKNRDNAVIHRNNEPLLLKTPTLAPPMREMPPQRNAGEGVQGRPAAAGSIVSSFSAPSRKLRLDSDLSLSSRLRTSIASRQLSPRQDTLSRPHTPQRQVTFSGKDGVSLSPPSEKHTKLLFSGSSPLRPDSLSPLRPPIDNANMSLPTIDAGNAPLNSRIIDARPSTPPAQQSPQRVSNIPVSSPFRSPRRSPIRFDIRNRQNMGDYVKSLNFNLELSHTRPPSESDRPVEIDDKLCEGLSRSEVIEYKTFIKNTKSLRQSNEKLIKEFELVSKELIPAGFDLQNVSPSIVQEILDMQNDRSEIACSRVEVNMLRELREEVTAEINSLFQAQFENAAIGTEYNQLLAEKNRLALQSGPETQDQTSVGSQSILSKSSTDLERLRDELAMMEIQLSKLTNENNEQINKLKRLTNPQPNPAARARELERSSRSVVDVSRQLRREMRRIGIDRYSIQGKCAYIKARYLTIEIDMSDGKQIKLELGFQHPVLQYFFDQLSTEHSIRVNMNLWTQGLSIYSVLQQLEIMGSAYSYNRAPPSALIFKISLSWGTLRVTVDGSSLKVERAASEGCQDPFGESEQITLDSLSKLISA